MKEILPIKEVRSVEIRHGISVILSYGLGSDLSTRLLGAPHRNTHTKDYFL